LRNAGNLKIKMVSLKLIQKRNKVRNLIRLNTFAGSYRNCVKIGSEGPVHFLIKSLSCYILKSRGVEFFTEAIIRRGKADILVLDYNQIIEIPISETEQSLKDKFRKYPEESEKLVLRVPDDLINALKEVVDNFDYDKYLEFLRQ